MKNPKSSEDAVHVSVAHAGNDRLGLDRLIFFSDAVFAIAITLLALDIQLPPTTDEVSNQEMLQMLFSLLPDYVAYITSFLLIGFFWMGHHLKFQSIIRYDRVVIWLNLFLLMVIAFIPFPTRVMSDFDNSVATMFYALTVATAGALNAAISFYAVYENRLVDENSKISYITKKPWRMVAVPIIFLLSVPIALIDSDWARLFWLLIIPISRL